MAPCIRHWITSFSGVNILEPYKPSVRSLDNEKIKKQEAGYPLLLPLPTIPLALASSVRLSILRSMFSFLVILKFYTVLELFTGSAG
jgi:pilus assembly protein TadC